MQTETIMILIILLTVSKENLKTIKKIQHFCVKTLSLKVLKKSVTDTQFKLVYILDNFVSRTFCQIHI